MQRHATDPAPERQAAKMSPAGGPAGKSARGENREEVRDVAPQGRSRSSSTSRTCGAADRDPLWDVSPRVGVASFAVLGRVGLSGRASSRILETLSRPGAAEGRPMPPSTSVAQGLGPETRSQAPATLPGPCSLVEMRVPWGTCMMRRGFEPPGDSTMPSETTDLPSFMEWKELTSLVGSMRTRSLVARPTTVEQCREVLAYCQQHDMTICARGAGRNYGDLALNDGNALLDMSDMNRILEFDEEKNQITARF